jgi:hypothetical protein
MLFEKQVSGLFSKFGLKIRNNFPPEASGYGEKFYHIFAFRIWKKSSESIS